MSVYISDIIKTSLDLDQDIMNIGFQLYQLQEIDSTLDNSNKRISEIDALLTNNDGIKKAQANLDKTKNQFVHDTNAFNELNDDIQRKKIKISQSEASLYSGKVKNPKELEDLQLEISSLKNTIKKLDDTLLEKLLRVDQSEKKLNQCKDALKNENSEFATQSALLRGEKSSLLDTIKVNNGKRLSLWAAIDTNSQNLYEKLRSNKNGLAVAKLDDGTCGACGSGLTASQIQEARSAAKLFICPSCRRIIYGSS
jgi:uncharacterized protein